MSWDRGAEGPPPRPSPRRPQREAIVIQGQANDGSPHAPRGGATVYAGALGGALGAALALIVGWVALGRPDLGGQPAPDAALSARLDDDARALRAAVADAQAAQAAAARARAETAGLGARLDRIAAALAAPKTATRADPISPAPAARAEAPPSARAVAALALVGDFDAGRPLGVDIVALERLGVSSAALAPLRPFGQTGAPSAAALARAFEAIRPEVARASASVAPNVLGVAGLVKIRKVGEAPAEVAALAQIGTALAAGDLAAALAAFADLPLAAQAAGQDWADRAGARLAAERAAQALLGGAVADLGTGR